MRVALLALLLASAPRAALACPDDPWLGRDKALHFAISVPLGGAGYGLGAAAFDEEPARWLTAALFAFTVGAGKEVYDGATGGCFSGKDLAWDGLGAAVGATATYLLLRALAPPPRSTPPNVRPDPSDAAHPAASKSSDPVPLASPARAEDGGRAP